MKHRIGRLHVLTDLRFGHTHEELANAALDGGADTIQLRCKDVSTRDIVIAGQNVGASCRRKRVPLIINDRTDIALAVDADGVHLGDSDLPLPSGRQILGPDRIIGASADTVLDVERNVQSGADYVGVGPVFSTDSKTDTGPVLGLERLRAIVLATRVPLIAIGGITLDNVEAVLQTGVFGIAIIGAIAGAADPESATRSFRDILDLSDSGPKS